MTRGRFAGDENIPRRSTPGRARRGRSAVRNLCSPFILPIDRRGTKHGPWIPETSASRAGVGGTCCDACDGCGGVARARRSPCAWANPAGATRAAGPCKGPFGACLSPTRAATCVASASRRPHEEWASSTRLSPKSSWACGRPGFCEVRTLPGRSARDEGADNGEGPPSAAGWRKARRMLLGAAGERRETDATLDKGKTIVERGAVEGRNQSIGASLASGGDTKPTRGAYAHLGPSRKRRGQGNSADTSMDRCSRN
jgi:hypothetical protein